MQTIAQQWEEFEAACVPDSAGAQQRMDMRCAFYAGFHRGFTTCWDIASESRDDRAAGVAMLQRFRDELERFAQDAAAGRA